MRALLAPQHPQARAAAQQQLQRKPVAGSCFAGPARDEIERLAGWDAGEEHSGCEGDERARWPPQRRARPQLQPASAAAQVLAAGPRQLGRRIPALEERSRIAAAHPAPASLALHGHCRGRKLCGQRLYGCRLLGQQRSRGIEFEGAIAEAQDERIGGAARPAGLE